MRASKRVFVWYFMLKKRLLKKVGFAALLFLVPILAFAMSVAAKGESGVVSIALAAEDPSDKAASWVINSLTEEDSAILFTVCETPEKAEETVAYGKADAAWIICEGLEEKARLYAETRDKDIKLAKLIQREENVFLKMSAEKLYGKLYRFVAYPIYEDFVSDYFGGDVDSDDLKKFSKAAAFDGSIVEFRALSGDAYAEDASFDILASPLRGLIMIVVIVCGMASEMFLQSDKRDGSFSRIPQKYRVLVSAGSDGAALTLAAAAAFVSLIFTGDAELSVKGVLWEALVLFVYVLSCVPFCVLLGRILKSPAAVGAAIPVISGVMLIACPIFLDIASLGFLRYLFPPFYYLGALHHPMYLLYALIYTAVLIVIVYAGELFQKFTHAPSKLT